MSAQTYGAPTSPPPSNPDTRTLPEGWITQFDDNYKTWFYVNTKVDPPVITWSHPLGAPGSSPQPPPYRAESNPTDVATNNPGPSAQQGQSQDRGLGSLFGRHKHDGNNYGGPPPQGGSYPQGNYGPPPQGYPGYGPPPQQQWGPPPQGYYGPPPGAYGGYPQYGGPPQPQVVYVQDGAKKNKPGMGPGTGALLGAGAGLLGGIFIANEMEDSYDDGFDNGAGDFEGGGDW